MDEFDMMNGGMPQEPEQSEPKDDNSVDSDRAAAEEFAQQNESVSQTESLSDEALEDAKSEETPPPITEESDEFDEIDETCVEETTQDDAFLTEPVQNNNNNNNKNGADNESPLYGSSPAGTEPVNCSGAENYQRQSAPDYSYFEPRPQKTKNKGLRVFCALLAVVLIVSLSICGGYFAGKGKSSSTNAGGKVSESELASRPEDDSELSDNYSVAFEKVNKSVVSILVYSTETQTITGSVSGVIYSEDGYIVINDHVYEDTPNAQFMVRLYNGKEYKASFVAGDTRSDLAVIKLNDKVKGLKAAVFGNSDDVVVGEPVITVGYPFSYGSSATVSHGIISAKDRRVTGTSTNYASTFLQTDAVINPGNSGGALCNMYGQVIGITSSKLAGDEYDAVSYAIPTKTMNKVVTSLINDGCVTDRAKLGITYTEINSVTAETSNVPVGVCIKSISDDSGLANKGFVENDIITHVNGTEITTSDILLNVIEDSKAGDTIELTVYKTKNKTSKTVSVKLLADKGTSSYSTESSSGTSDGGVFEIPDKSDNNDSEDSGSDSSKTFDFPLD